jgi:hypothetical protein
MLFSGLSLDLPAGFAADEAMLSLRAPTPAKSLVAPVAQKQTPIRPSLIVHRRLVGPDVPLEMLAGEVCAELASSIVGLTQMATESFAFKDGAPGFLVGFDFPAAEVGTARQYHALRKDGALLTTATLTLDALTLTPAAKATWLATLASIVTHETGALP